MRLVVMEKLRCDVQGSSTKPREGEKKKTREKPKEKEENKLSIQNSVTKINLKLLLPLKQWRETPQTLSRPYSSTKFSFFEG
jgi:hypothetical protein